MQLKSTKMPLWLFCIIFCAFYCLSVTVCEFHGVPISDSYSFAITAMQWCIVALCTCGPLIFISLNRWIFAIAAPILIAFSAGICYYNLTLGTRLTPATIELAMVNDFDIWLTLINLKIVLLVILAILVSSAIVLCRWKYVRSSRNMTIILGIIGVLLTLLPTKLVEKFNAPVAGRLPYSIYYSFSDYIENRSTISENRTTYDGVACRADTIAPDVYVIIGESLRADHLPMNGYLRNTMPRLMQDTALISFPNIYTEYTYTHVSVPHILTQYNPANEDYAYDEQSFITLFNKAGYKTAWFANQDLVNSYTYFAHECDSIFYINANRSMYSYEKWLDSEILPEFTSWISNNKNENKLAVIHSIGSHWWYRSHYLDSERNFKPEITHKDVGGLSHEEMVNSYDNTILATDDFLADTFELIKKTHRPAVVLYISDHGESLGEEGVYLHGKEVEPLHYPACFVWYTPEYAAKFPHTIDSLKQSYLKTATTTQIFDTVLELSQIKISDGYTKNSIIGLL